MDDYRDVVKKHWDEVRGDKWRVVSFAELMRTPQPRKPQHSDRWGQWMLDAERLVLIHVGGGCGYELDLERMRTPAEMLDSIFQVRPKIWHTDDDMSALIDALHDLLDPQATLCSWGVTHELKEPAKFIGKRIEHYPTI